ncbi:protease modulator HflC, partial [Shewanella algae]
MNSDLYRVAKENRAKGFEASQTIKSEADKERTIILANAEKTAKILHGEGDALAAEISAKAYGQDPKFYVFDRTMQLYQET